jgi:hypothetical protein
MASFAYDSYMDDVLAGNIVKTDTYYVMLTTSAYAPNQATHTKRSDVTSEVSGTGYTAGGQVIVPTFTKDTTNHKNIVTFPQVTWPSSTITARCAVYYKHRGGAATADELVAVDDFGGDVVTSNGALTLYATTINLGTAV